MVEEGLWDHTNLSFSPNTATGSSVTRQLQREQWLPLVERLQYADAVLRAHSLNPNSSVRYGLLGTRKLRHTQVKEVPGPLG